MRGAGDGHAGQRGGGGLAQRTIPPIGSYIYHEPIQLQLIDPVSGPALGATTIRGTIIHSWASTVAACAASTAGGSGEDSSFIIISTA